MSGARWLHSRFAVATEKSREEPREGFLKERRLTLLQYPFLAVKCFVFCYSVWVGGFL